MLSVSIPGGNIDLGTVTPGDDATASTTIDVTSNLTLGYHLFVSDTSDTDAMTGAGTIPDWTAAWNAPTTWPAATPGYAGVTVLSATGGKDTGTWGTGTDMSDPSTLKFVGVRNTNPSLLFDNGGPSTGTDSIVVGIRVAPSTTTTAGAYSGTLTFTVVSTP